MIRTLNQNDHDLFLKMEQKFYCSHAVLHPVPEYYFEETFRQVMMNSPFVKAYLIEENGKAAGYFILNIMYSNEVGGLIVWIEELYIDEAFRNCGIGTKVLDFVRNEYQGKAKRLRLEVTPENEGAIKLYEKKGYETLEYVQMILDL